MGLIDKFKDLVGIEDIDEDEESDDDDYGCDYERHPLNSSYYEDARFM